MAAAVATVAAASAVVLRGEPAPHLRGGALVNGLPCFSSDVLGALDPSVSGTLRTKIRSSHFGSSYRSSRERERCANALTYFAASP